MAFKIARRVVAAAIVLRLDVETISAPAALARA